MANKGPMETRSKSKILGSSGDSVTEGQDTLGPEISIREFELNEIERSIRNKENRLRIQENSLRQ